jgi:uncharacterized protein (DUF169 family)
MKKNTDWKHLDETIRAFLGMKQYLVGVKILNEEISLPGIKGLDKPTAFCRIVRDAGQGEAYLYQNTEEGCPTAEIILGFKEPKYAELEPRVKPSRTKYVYVASLNIFRGDPDVILCIVNPKQMMNLTQTFQSITGESLKVSFRGESSCSDFFAFPYMEGKPNISFMCNGARLLGEFRDNELVFGAPAELYLKLAETMDRLSKTGGSLCGCKTSDLSPAIVHSFDKIGLSKSTDYFFGRVGGWNVRAYLNRDAQGRLKLLTIHVPLRLDAKEAAADLEREVERVLSAPYRCGQRENWLDISMMADVDELNVDLETGENLYNIVKKVLEKIGKDLRKAGYAGPKK